MIPALLATALPADPTGWWVSEKYDGIRAIWTGKRLMSRNGRDLNPPAWFTAALPDVRLDGELWMGRGMFDATRSAIQRRGGSWCDVQFMIFDLAESGEFEDRMKTLASVLLPAHALAVRHWQCRGHADLDATERAIVGAGGEGLVLRRPGCLYRPGRAGDVVKVKRLRADAERWQG